MKVNDQGQDGGERGCLWRYHQRWVGVARHAGNGVPPMLLVLLLAVGSCGPATPAPPALPDLGPLYGVDEVTRAQLASSLKRLEARPSDVRLWVDLAHKLDQYELDDPAARVWEGVIALDPHEVEWTYRAGVAAVRAREVDRARGWFRAALTLHPEHRASWRRIGQLDLENGDAAGARVAFERLKQLAPGKPDGATGLAMVALLDEDTEEALVHIDEASRLAPSDLFLRHLRGSALRMAGHADEALSHLSAGLGSAPSWTDEVAATAVETPSLARSEQDLMTRADGLAAEARLSEAATLYRRVLVLRPNDGKVRTRLAIVLAQDGHVADGLALIEEGLIAAPRRYDLLLAKVDVMRIGGREEAAMTAVDMAVEAWPDRVDAWLVRGTIFRDRGELDRALRDFAAASRLDPERLQSLALAADIHMRRGDFHTAAQLLEAPLDDPTKQLSLDYFELLLQAQAGARRPEMVRRHTLDRAIAIHGAAASRLTGAQGGGR